MAKIIIQTVCVIAFIFSTVGLIRYFYSYQQVEQELHEVQEVYQETSQKEEKIATKFGELKKINADIVGWLELQGEQLNNPILQTTDNNFYLTHNYAGEKSRAGSIFMDYRNDENARHTILYGHVMRNGTMFGELAKFAEPAYVQKHPYFIYETPSKRYRLEVFAAYETTTDFYYIETDFSNASFEAFLQTIQQKSLIQTPVQVTAFDRIVTLSTCTTSPFNEERFVVHAKMVEEK